MRILYVCFGALLLSLSACATKTVSTEDSQAIDFLLNSNTQIIPADKALAQETAIRFQDAINQSDAEAASELFDYSIMVQEVINQIDLSNLTAKEALLFKSGFRKGMQKSIASNYIDRYIEIFESTEGYAEFRDFSHLEADKPIIRFDFQDEGMGYLVLDVDSKGKIYDFVDLSDGKRLTKSTADSVQIMFGSSPTINAFDENNTTFNTLSEFRQYMNKQEYKLAYSKLYELPEEVKAESVICSLLFEAASLSGDEALYYDALKHINTYQGDNPDLAFLLVDYHFYEGDYAEAIRSIESVESIVGDNDGLLKQMKSNIYLLAEDFVSAENQLDLSMLAEPNNENLILGNIDSYIYVGAYDKALKLVDTLNNEFGYGIGKDVLKSVSGEDFINSSEFQNWQP